MSKIDGLKLILTKKCKAKLQTNTIFITQKENFICFELAKFILKACFVNIPKHSTSSSHGYRSIPGRLGYRSLKGKTYKVTFGTLPKVAKLFHRYLPLRNFISFFKICFFKNQSGYIINPYMYPVGLTKRSV